MPDLFALEYMTTSRIVRTVVGEVSVCGFGTAFVPCFSAGRGYAVKQLVEALRYKPEGRGFDSRWGHWNFSVT